MISKVLLRTVGLCIASVAFPALGQRPNNGPINLGANPNTASGNVMKMWENGGPRPAAVQAGGIQSIPGNVGWGIRDRRHCRVPWRPYWDYGYYGGYSNVQFVGASYYPGIAYPGFGYDPYVSNIQFQNLQLQQQLDQAMAANRQLQQNFDANRDRINLPVRNRKDGDQAARDRQKNQDEKARGLALAGNRLFAAGNYSKAADRYRDAIKASADDATNYFLLAQAQFAARQYSDASRSLKDGLKLNPDWIENDFDVRTLYGDPDLLTPQLAEIARAVKVNPLDRDANFLLGFELFMSGQKDKARPILEQTARLETNDRHLKPFFDFFEKQANAN